MHHDARTRRRFIRDLLVAGGAISAGLVVLESCGGGGPSLEEIERKAKSYDANLTCTDTSGLWPAEVDTRTSNQYVDRSTTPGQHCFNCTNFIPPKEKGACGTCNTVKGPINPLGWCRAWTEARA